MLLLLANIALCEFMLLHRCVGYVQSAIPRLEEKSVKYTTGQGQLDSCDADTLVLEINTKLALVESRQLYLSNRIGDMRTLLAKKTLFNKKRTVSDYKCILRYFQSSKTLEASYMDIIDPRIDPSLPGVLAQFALSSEHSHKVPALLNVPNSKIPQVLVCAAINEMLPGKTAIKLSSIDQATLTAKDVSYLVPEKMVVSVETYEELTQLTTQAVLCNSKVALDQFLISYGMFLQQSNPIGYTGRLDCSVLAGVKMEDDPLIMHCIYKLLCRYAPLFDLLKFPIPYKRPSQDEVNVASRIFQQLSVKMFDSEIQPPEGRLTTDYLAHIMPSETVDLLKIISQPLIKDLTKYSQKYLNPTLLAYYGWF